MGVLSLYSSNKDAFSEDHERILEVVARQVSIVMAEVYGGGKEGVAGRELSVGLPNLDRLSISWKAKQSARQPLRTSHWSSFDGRIEPQTLTFNY